MNNNSNFININNNNNNNNNNENNNNIGNNFKIFNENNNNNDNNILNNVDFKKMYEKNLKEILDPIISNDSYNNCNKLIYFIYNQFRGNNVIDIVNDKKVIKNSKKYENIFNLNKIKFNPSIFKESKIQRSDCYQLFYTLSNLLGPENIDKPGENFSNSNNDFRSRSLEGFKNLCRMKIHSDMYQSAPLTIFSSKKLGNFSYMAKTQILHENKDLILSCISKKKIIIGFIDIFTKIPKIGIDHKNCLIIDNKNKILIRFEPKSFDTLHLRQPITESIIKKQLSEVVGNVLNDYNYIVINGGQSTLSITKKYDNVYCLVYSLYCGLLFLKNYNLFFNNIKNFNEPFLQNNINNYKYLPKNNINRFKHEKINNFFKKINKAPFEFLLFQINIILNNVLEMSINKKDNLFKSIIESKSLKIRKSSFNFVNFIDILRIQQYNKIINLYLNNINDKDTNNIFNYKLDKELKKLLDKKINIDLNLLDKYLLYKKNNSRKVVLNIILIINYIY